MWIRRTDCNKRGFIYTGKIQPLTASTDRGRTDACTLQKARGRERVKRRFQFQRCRSGRGRNTAGGGWKNGRGRERERERRELSKGEKSRHVLLTSQEQKDTERAGERDRGQRTEDPFCGAIGASKIKYLLARSPARPRLPHSLGVVSCVASFSLTTHDHRGRRRHRGSLIPGFLFLRPFAASRSPAFSECGIGFRIEGRSSW